MLDILVSLFMVLSVCTMFTCMGYFALRGASDQQTCGCTVFEGVDVSEPTDWQTVEDQLKTEMGHALQVTWILERRLNAVIDPLVCDMGSSLTITLDPRVVESDPIITIVAGDRIFRVIENLPDGLFGEGWDHMRDKAARADRNLTWFMAVLFGGIVLTYLGYGLLTVGAAQMATNLGNLVDDLIVPVMTGILLGVTVGLLMGRMSDRRWGRGWASSRSLMEMIPEGDLTDGLFGERRTGD
jgi:hypothetical protein